MIPPRRWLILAVISSALLLIVIDMTVLYTALTGRMLKSNGTGWVRCRS